ncbi:MAG: hypothetical protein JO287_02170, partial [Pseudonocardiales bacterium]|nr:hypothetical protein [Pseudonocardiales bacterium]
MVATVEKSGARGVALPWTVDPTVLASQFFDRDGFAQAAAARAEDARAYLPSLIEHFQQDRPEVVCYDLAAVMVPELAAQFDVPSVVLCPTYTSNEHFSLRKAFIDSQITNTGKVLAEIGKKLAEIAAEFGLSGNPEWMGIPQAGLKLVFLPPCVPISRRHIRRQLPLHRPNTRLPRT